MDKGHTVKAYAEAKSLSESTVRRMIRDGQVDSKYFRGCVRIFENPNPIDSSLRGASGYLRKNTKDKKVGK